MVLPSHCNRPVSLLWDQLFSPLVNTFPVFAVAVLLSAELIIKSESPAIGALQVILAFLPALLLTVGEVLSRFWQHRSADLNCATELPRCAFLIARWIQNIQTPQSGLIMPGGCIYIDVFCNSSERFLPPRIYFYRLPMVCCNACLIEQIVSKVSRKMKAHLSL